MQTDNTNIAGKVVVITGASSGLGEATARYLAERGATVVLGARRAERLQALVEEITRAGGKASAIVTDVTDAAQVQALVDAAVEQYGRIDVILNNAGVMPHSPLERRKIDDWNRTIDINIKGVLYGIAAALPHMQRQKSGHIINVSSVAGHRVGPGSAVYAATKTAVRVISEGLRQEVKPWNLRTTIISPGAVATELPNSITEADVAKGIGQFYEQYAIPPIRSLVLWPSRSVSRKTWISTRSSSGRRGRNSDLSTSRSNHAHAHIGKKRTAGVGTRLRVHGTELRLRPGDGSECRHRDHPGGCRCGRDVLRHGRSLRAVHERRTGRRGAAPFRDQVVIATKFGFKFENGKQAGLDSRPVAHPRSG